MLLRPFQHLQSSLWVGGERGNGDENAGEVMKFWVDKVDAEVIPSKREMYIMAGFASKAPPIIFNVASKWVENE